MQSTTLERLLPPVRQANSWISTWSLFRCTCDRENEKCRLHAAARNEERIAEDVPRGDMLVPVPALAPPVAAEAKTRVASMRSMAQRSTPLETSSGVDEDELDPALQGAVQMPGRRSGVEGHGAGTALVHDRARPLRDLRDRRVQGGWLEGAARCPAQRSQRAVRSGELRGGHMPRTRTFLVDSPILGAPTRFRSPLTAG
jgi:hypothetical protein